MKRPIIGGVLLYKGHRIHVEVFDDLFILKVDDKEVGNFFTDNFAAENRGKAHIDEQERIRGRT